MDVRSWLRSRAMARHHFEAEIRHVAERAAMAFDHFEQHFRAPHPGHRVDQHQRHVQHHRHQEARDEAHVVIERQPRDDAVVRPELEHLVVGRHVRGHLGDRQRNALPEPCRA